MSSNIIDFIFCRGFLYQSLATLVTLAILRLAIFYRQRLKRYNLLREYGIPMTKPSLLYGHFHLYRQHVAQFRADDILMKKFDKYYGTFIGDEPCLTITDAELLKKVFLQTQSSFKERMVPYVETPVTTGIFFAKHDRWKLYRTKMAATFNKYAVRGDSSTKFIEASIKLMVDYIDSKLTKANRTTVDMLDLMNAMALNLISAIALRLPDIQVREKEPHVRSLRHFLSLSNGNAVLIAIMFSFMKPLITVLANHFQYNTAMLKIHMAVEGVVKKTIIGGKPPVGIDSRTEHVIDTLIAMYRERKISKAELIANIDSILIAGYDTTSTTLTYIFAVLGKRLDIQDKLRIELMTHGIDSDYLVQVINEALRLYPVVIDFTTRIATETVTIDSLTIPQGTKVVYNEWLMHRHPDLWPEPEKFDPSRFDGSKEIHPCAFAPFGLGERKCLGYKLAMLEMKMVVCEILLKYRIRTIRPDKLEIRTHSLVLTKPAEKVELEFEKLGPD